MLTNFQNHAKRSKKQMIDRQQLTPPVVYYRNQFKNIQTKNEWVTVTCCFHSPDKNPSLSLNLIHGHFKCHACCAKGGDIITFHQLRYRTSFIETIDCLRNFAHGY